LRSANKLNILDWLKTEDADIICLQEVRAQEDICVELLKDFENYNIYYNCGIKKGYSGTILISKNKPIEVNYGLNGKKDDEGRLITARFENFVILNCYVPNGANRLDYKMDYLKKLLLNLKKLREKNNVILCCDMNIAHNEIDVNKPKAVSNRSGFLKEERKVIDKLIKNKFEDSFRYLNKNKIQFTWRSYKSRKMSSDFGWKYRFDYIFINEELKNKINNCESLDLVYSDHLPVILEINI
jgi:exodeoxyribonuclease-3